jgi:hypothetical protein
MKNNSSLSGSWKSVRFTLTFALLFAVSTFGFYACTQKEAPSPTPNLTKTNSPVRGNKNVLVNPYDYIGVFHNDALRHFSVQSNFQTLTQTEAIDLTASLYRSQNLPDANLLTSQVLQQFYTINPQHNLKILADSLYAISAISYEVKTAWTTISDHFTDPTLRNFSNYKVAFAHLRNNIAQTEQTLLQNTYNNVDKAQIFSVVATAKHSATFWEGVLDDPNNPYYELQGRVKWWEWILIAAADAAGAATGLPNPVYAASTGAVFSLVAYKYFTQD